MAPQGGVHASHAWALDSTRARFADHGKPDATVAVRPR